MPTTQKAAYIENDEETPLHRGRIILLKEVENELVAQTLENEGEYILKIKKPDYLGHSKWEVKHGNHPLRIAIIDLNWIDRFHRKEILLGPGDSIRARIRTVDRYDRRGNVIDTNYEIAEVLDIIRGNLDD